LLDVVADGARKMRNGPPRMIVQDLAYVALKRQRDREEEYGNARKRRRLLVEVLEDIPAREAAAPAAETATTDVVAAAEEAAAAEQAAVDQAARIAGARAAAETAAAAEAKEAAANEAAANEAAANEAAANEAAANEAAANEAAANEAAANEAAAAETAANEAAATARALEQADAASRAALRAACAAVAAADDPAAVEVEYGVLLDDHARSLRRFAAACSRARRVVAPAWPADDEDVSGAALAERLDAARTEAFGAVEPCLSAQMDLLRADLAGAEGAVAAILEAPGDSRRESAASSFSERDEDDDSSAAVWAALEKHAGAFEAARARVAEELEVDAAIEASSASLEAAEAWARDAEAAVSEPRDWRAAATLDEAAARFEALSVAAVPHIVGLGARQEAIAALPARREARNDLVDRARAVGERLVRHASGLKSHHEAVGGDGVVVHALVPQEHLRGRDVRRDAPPALAAALRRRLEAHGRALLLRGPARDLGVHDLELRDAVLAEGHDRALHLVEPDAAVVGPLEVVEDVGDVVAPELGHEALARLGLDAPVRLRDELVLLPLAEHRERPPRQDVDLEHVLALELGAHRVQLPAAHDVLALVAAPQLRVAVEGSVEAERVQPPRRQRVLQALGEDEAHEVVEPHEVLVLLVLEAAEAEPRLEQGRLLEGAGVVAVVRRRTVVELRRRRHVGNGRRVEVLRRLLRRRRVGHRDCVRETDDAGGRPGSCYRCAARRWRGDTSTACLRSRHHARM